MTVTITWIYSTLNKITQFWLVESSTLNPKLYSVGVPIKFPWKQRNFVECTINKKSHDLLVQFVNRYSWFWKFSNCTRLKARAILRTLKITRTYKSRIVLEVVRFPIQIIYIHEINCVFIHNKCPRDQSRGILHNAFCGIALVSSNSGFWGGSEVGVGVQSKPSVLLIKKVRHHNSLTYPQNAKNPICEDPQY